MEALETSKGWLVTIGSRLPFTMVGEDITQPEALAIVRCIWATTPADQIKVEPSIK